MKAIILIACLAAIAFSQGCQSDEDLYNNKCVKKTCFETYIPRFKTVANGTGIGRIPITFVGTVQFVPGTGNVEVTLQFTDTENDGTMQRDNSNSCLTAKLSRYGSIEYTNGSEYSTTITSSFDSANLYRAWKFVIPGTDLKTVLVEDASDTKYLTYHGYFGYEFQVAGLTLQFKLRKICPTKQVQLSNLSSKKEIAHATHQENVQLKLTLHLLSVTLQVIVPLPQLFAIVQKITTPGFETFYLKPLSVTFKGDGLNRQVSTFVNTVQAAGQTTVTLPVSFVYPSLQVVLQSELRSAAGRRMLTSSRFLADSGSEVGGALATATSDSLNCIKTSESASCPSCAEQCANGAVSPSCTCNNGYMLILSLALVLLAFL